MAGAMRIPRIKFPRRLPNPSSSAGPGQHAAEPKAATPVSTRTLSSDVPRPPSTTAVGGNASLQPKRTPVTDQEIEAILLGGCI